MTEFDPYKLATSSENVGYAKAKLDLFERIQNLHKPSEIAAEVILWLKEDPTKAE